MVIFYFKTFNFDPFYNIICVC